MQSNTVTVLASGKALLAALAIKPAGSTLQAEGKSTDRANIVMSSAVQVCFEKAASYFELEEKFTNCT
ncbi:hypothetical protein EYZ11_012808 [Aspergillus tanneri]|uniref:Uncharacterized protein n=1 Tax=Aspergillus tanneri TaxID=1220188 RepID=A0A4S3IZ93_9EURO|nr:hypothetical protein EYZ11_012808 [Aspergillus tanneri]